MKKNDFKLPDNFCLFCDMALPVVDKAHTLKVHDHRDNTVSDITVKCRKNK